MQTQFENSPTSHRRGFKGSQVAAQGPTGADKGQKGLIGSFCTIFLVKNIYLVVFDSKSAREQLENESTTRKRPQISHNRGTGGHKWPDRDQQGQKGTNMPSWLFFYITDVIHKRMQTCLDQVVLTPYSMKTQQCWSPLDQGCSNPVSKTTFQQVLRLLRR